MTGGWAQPRDGDRAVADGLGRRGDEIGRASCRERGEISVGGGSFKKKKKDQRVVRWRGKQNIQGVVGNRARVRPDRELVCYMVCGTDGPGYSGLMYHPMCEIERSLC